MRFVPKFISHAIDKCYTYTIIKLSGLFDTDWYIKTYSDVSGTSPLKHFIKKGYKKAYNPSIKFSSSRYTTAYPETQGTNPLVHYLKIGRFNGYIRYEIDNKIPAKEHVTAEEPLISIIVITCNNEYQDIDKTIESIISQTYKNFEVIIVDDTTKNNFIQPIITKYKKINNKINLYQPNSSERNLRALLSTGIEKSKGQYVAFCECPDYWTQNHLENKITVINQYDNVNIISNDIELIGNENKIIQREIYIQNIKQLLRNGGNKIDLRHNQEFNYIPTLSAVMIKADVIKKLDFNSPDATLIDFWIYRQILKENLLFYTDKKLTYWNRHDSYNNKTAYSIENSNFISVSNNLIGVTPALSLRCIKKSHFFDKKYYKTQIGDTNNIRSLAEHYYTIGWKQGLNPSKHFDGDSYLSFNRDIISLSQCPLFHYEIYGKFEHRQYVSVSESCTYSININDINNIKDRKKNQKVILLVSHELSLTGAPRALLYLAQSLKKCNVYPVIVSPKDGELRNEIEESGIECKVVMSIVCRSQDLNPSRIPFSKYVENFDAILLNTIDLASIVEGLSEIPIRKYCWVHEGYMGFDNNLYNGKLAYYLSMFDQVLVVGNYAYKILSQRTKNRIHATQLLYGIEDNRIDVYSPCDIKTKIRMAIVGTVDQRKGCDLLVDCVQFIPAEIRDKIEIFVIGKPSDKKIVNKILRCNKIDFKMIGNVEHDKLLEIMTSIDVLLCPSIDDPMPIVCTEAMMLSKPIIASTNTGTSYIIQDGKEGFIFNSGDAKHLAKSIIKSVNNSHKLSEMGIYARQVYEKFFTMEQFYKNVEGIFLHGNE